MVLFSEANARPGMEPGDLRESPAGSGESDAGDWREVIPGGHNNNNNDEEEDEEGVKGVETNRNPLETCEEGESDKQKCVGEQLHSPYEEELDPRIQVREPGDVFALFGGSV